jgi:DinB superfamily
MSAARGEQRLATLLRDHGAAVREYVERANAVGDGRWLVPRAEGKWTPAQETRHLILAYEALCRDLSGGPKMALRGTPARRLVWRIVGLTSILWRKRIPVAVRSPREARPEWEPASPAELLPQLQRKAREFDEQFTRVWRAEPGRCVTHPFFGAITLDHAIRFSCVHTRHHAAFLPPLETS